MGLKNSVVRNNESSPFDNLPDELVLKIIRTALKSHPPRLCKTIDWVDPYDFLFHTIARTSTRFQKIAEDKSLKEIAASLRILRIPRKCSCIHYDLSFMKANKCH